MSLERITEKIGMEDNFLGRITRFIARKTSAYAAAFSVATTALVWYAGCTSDMPDSGGYESSDVENDPELQIPCIAFISGEDIFVMNGNGKNKKQLTQNHKVMSISPSPDRKRIAFVSYQDGEQYDIYVIDIDGNNERNLTTDLSTTFSGGSDDIFPAWSPNGEYLAFVTVKDSEGIDNKGILYVTNGADKRILADDVYLQRPAWSPDGEKIAYTAKATSYTDGIINGESLEIMVVDSDGSNRKNVTNNRTNDQHPAWVQNKYNGGVIYFDRDREEHDDTDIYFVRLHDGIQGKRIISGQYPVPSPNSNQSEIAFLSTENSELFVDDEDNEPERMTHTDSGINHGFYSAFISGGGWWSYFSWSSSGVAIVASSGERLHLINVRGGDKKQITGNEYSHFSDPVWLPSCVEDRYRWAH